MARQIRETLPPVMPLQARDHQALAEMFEGFDTEQMTQIDTMLNNCFGFSDSTHEDSSWVLTNLAIAA